MISPDRKARKKLKRHEQILEAAYQVFREVGYSAATVDLIAERADIAKGTIYIYFKSKEDLYFSLLVNGLDILIDLLREMAANNPSEDPLRETAKTLFQFYTDYTDYFRLFMVMQQEDMQAKLTPELSDQLNARGTTILKALSTQIKSLANRGRSYGPVDPWNIANIIWGAFTGITQLAITREHLKVRSTNIEDLLNLCFTVIHRGLSSDSGGIEPTRSKKGP